MIRQAFMSADYRSDELEEFYQPRPTVLDCRMNRIAALIASLPIACVAFGQVNPSFGHSHLGSAFDTGLRSKPWKFEGIGNSPFPISTKNPEVQAWYDQGNALLHNFWFEEAERTFRWCLKLEPENAMVYFGLARCGLNLFSSTPYPGPELTRSKQFLKEAVKRKGSVTERERLYIETWDAAWAKSGEETSKELVKHLEALCLKYPDDIEAKCQLAFFNMGKGSALANEYMIQQVLKVNPLHPGAHHARIHNWDGENGSQALVSCEQYGRIAPTSGHANHMPGHIYSGIGMWHEAAIAMDSATRVELRHMTERMAFPSESWNYPHNRDYLSYIQEQLGKADASLAGSRDILNAPKDPTVPTSQYPAIFPFTRALLKFGMWERILDEKTWPAGLEEQWMVFKLAAQAIAHAELGNKEAARETFEQIGAGLKAMIAAEVAKLPDQADKIRKDIEDNMPILFRIAEAKVLTAEGKRLDGQRILLELAEKERVVREKGSFANDPPVDPWPALRLVGDMLLSNGDLKGAADAYEQTLKNVPNDAWSLAGLAKAHHRLGNQEQASRYAARFLSVWSGADPDLQLKKEILALNLNVEPKSETPKPERAYSPASLDALGPSNWQPFTAPDLDCLDVNGKRVRLADFKGKNVLMVFYLSDQCVHCVDQLTAINKRITEFSDLNTVVLGVSSAKPATNKQSLKLAPFSIKLLSDTNHSNARRFASYDDFEEMELHSTILIDGSGRVRWKKTGGDPFTDIDYLIKEINRWQK